MNKFGIKLPRAHKRIEQIFGEIETLIKQDDVFVDVGTDHGYLPVMVKKNNLCKKVVATDISAPSLKKAEKLAEHYDCDIDLRVGDGLEVAADATFAAICGIGGNEIIKIINQGVICDKMVLQPVPSADDLRQFLITSDYHILKDYVIEDENKFYFLFVIDGKGKNNYSNDDMWFGKTNLIERTPDFYKYLKSLVNKLKFLKNFDITGLSENSRKEIEIKKNFYDRCVELILENEK